MLQSAPEGHRPLPLLRIALGLAAVGLSIVLLSLGTLLAHRATDGPLSEHLYTVHWYVDVGREHNLATWFASGLWLLLGALAAAIALAGPARRGAWWLLSVVALVASVDEQLEVHERLDVLGARIADRLGLELGFPWVLAGAPIALVIGLLLLRLVLSLPRRARWAVIDGGALFLAGAVGVETLTGRTLAAAEGVVTLRFLYGTMVEELAEMTGLSLALAGVLSLLCTDPSGATLRLDPAVRRAVQTAATTP